IDALEVEILIICKNQKQFQQTASFLSRRGWPTLIMDNLSKAIDHVVKNSPDFVMISCNHPSPGTQRLPGLLAQMNVHCIAFAEQTDSATTQKLNNSSIRNKLQGLASGPNVQRMIRKLLMDIYNPQQAQREQEGSSDHAGVKDKTVVSGS